MDLSKFQCLMLHVFLCAGAGNINVVSFFLPYPIPAFTLQPMKVFGPAPSAAQMHFLSTLAVFTDDGTSTDIILWTINNTDTLSSASPQLSLNAWEMYAGPYGVPPPANQKDGFRPYAQDQNQAGTPGFLDTSDTRVLSVVYAAGKLWGAFTTSTNVNGRTLTGSAIVQVSKGLRAGTGVQNLYAGGRFALVLVAVTARQCPVGTLRGLLLVLVPGWSPHLQVL